MSGTVDIAAEAKVLVVDDEEANVLLLQTLLRREGLRGIVSTTRPREVVSLFDEVGPDLILLDLMMPELDGFALLDEIARRVPSGSYCPVLVLTADVTLATRRRALALGAKDFVTKPFDAVEVMLRVWNLLETRFLHRELARAAVQVEIRRGGLAAPQTSKRD